MQFDRRGKDVTQSNDAGFAIGSAIPPEIMGGCAAVLLALAQMPGSWLLPLSCSKGVISHSCDVHASGSVRSATSDVLSTRQGSLLLQGCYSFGFRSAPMLPNADLARHAVQLVQLHLPDVGQTPSHLRAWDDNPDNDLLESGICIDPHTTA